MWVEETWMEFLNFPWLKNPTSHSAVYTSDFGSLIDKVNKVENIYFLKRT